MKLEKRLRMAMFLCLFTLWMPLTLQAVTTSSSQINYSDSLCRTIIREYVEVAITAHRQKNMKIPEDFWSVPDPHTFRCATGRKCIDVVMSGPTFWKVSLRKLFKTAKISKCDLNDMKITQHPMHRDVYGLSQDLTLTIDQYSECGYMFLKWDFCNPDEPQIHVRTWQPVFIDKEKKQKINPDDIYTLADFDL